MSHVLYIYIYIYICVCYNWFNGNYNGVYWYVMDSIGGMLNLIGKMPKTQ